MRRLTLLLLLLLAVALPARAQLGCTTNTIALTGTGFYPIYDNSKGEVVNVQAGYFASGSPASVSTQLAAGYFQSALATPYDLGSASTNTTGADIASQTGTYPIWFIHVTTLSTGGTLNYKVCVTNNVSKNAPLSSVSSNLLIKGGGAGTASSVTDNGTTVSSAESLTFSGGIVPNSTAKRYCTGGGAGVALATAGTNTTLAAATTFTYVSQIYLPVNMTVTGISLLSGGTAGAADHWEVALYTSAGGAVVAQSATAASPAATNTFTDYAFSATYAAVGPGRFWIAMQSDGITDKLQTMAAANSWGDILTQKPASTVYGTFPSLTAPTTFTATVGPIACLY